MKSDADLLWSYASERCQPDFSTFVQRHLGFVYRAALRRSAGNSHRAKEISQQVFTEAARRAAALARHPCLAGWLHTATGHAAINLARAERRRRIRETKAFHMTADESSAPSLQWEHLQPVIDSALDTLSSADRAAVLARFFEENTFREIGDRLRLSENAARMRVDRALEQLRGALVRRGVSSTAAALAVVLTAQPAAAVPAGLGGAIAAAATAHTFTGWIALLATNKVKLAIGVAAVAGIVAPPLVQMRANQQLEAELRDLRAANADARSENSRAQRAWAAAAAASVQPGTAELFALRQRAAVLEKRPPGVVEAELHAAANCGWKTPEAAFETITWAFQADDWRTMGAGLTYDTATRAKAEAFYASLPDAVRQQYGTMEQYFSHAWYEDSLAHRDQLLPERIQVFKTELADGAEPVVLSTWGVYRDGREVGNRVRFERTRAGWGLGASQTAGIVTAVIRMTDALTGKPKSATASLP